MGVEEFRAAAHNRMLKKTLDDAIASRRSSFLSAQSFEQVVRAIFRDSGWEVTDETARQAVHLLHPDGCSCNTPKPWGFAWDDRLHPSEEILRLVGLLTASGTKYKDWLESALAELKRRGAFTEE